jgi:FkbM family methyltransferase
MTALGHIPLIVLKNFFFHLVCRGSDQRYFALKARAMMAAARFGMYESAYFDLLPLFIRPGSTVIDVGANYGAYTLAMARLVGPSGRVFAFEPLPTTADLLERQSAASSNIVVIREALSDGGRDSIELRAPFLHGGVPEPALAAVDPAPWHADGLQTWRVFRVPVRKLDDHLALFHDVSFIKVDVEGHEAAFLSGAAGTMQRFRPVVQFETAGIRAGAERVNRWLRGARYALLILRNRQLEIASVEAAVGLNAYVVPEEMLDALPAAVLHRST